MVYGNYTEKLNHTSQLKPQNQNQQVNRSSMRNPEKPSVVVNSLSNYNAHLANAQTVNKQEILETRLRKESSLDACVLSLNSA